MAQSGPVPVDNGSERTRQAWRLLESEGRDLGRSDLRIQPLTDFLEAAEQHRTRLADRQTILDQAVLIFDHLYPHMPFKTDIYQVAHPSDYIRQQIQPKLESLSEIEFQAHLISAFSLVRDAHTLYGLPSPYRGAVAFLPFQMRPYLDHKAGWRFIVSSVMNTEPDQGFGHEYFGAGVEIVRWGELDTLGHVERTAAHLPSGNYFACLERGSLHATLRPLIYIQPPFPDEMPAVTIQYRPHGSDELRAIQFPWGVGTGFGAHAGFDGAAFSVSPATAATRSFSKFLHHRAHLQEDRSAQQVQDPEQTSTIPDIFDFQYTGGARKIGYIDLDNLVDRARPEARFGYIRIKAFSDGSAAPGSSDRIVEEFRRILKLLDEKAPDGLIIDIRSNPGGDVQAAERMLQMLTPNPIEPTRFHLANTTVILDILRHLKESITDRLSTSHDLQLVQTYAELEAWIDDAEQPALPDGPRLTSGQPLTNPDSANDVGQIYQGQGVALIINSLTYSAADIFAAGFQDHQVGVLLGASMVTGGGGANVWRHEDLLNKIGPRQGMPLMELPGDASITLAIRRCSRVGRNDGMPVEDQGVEAEVFHPADSVEEVISGNPGILRRACEELRSAGVHRVDATNVVLHTDGSVAVDVRTTNIVSLKFLLNGLPALTVAAVDGVAQTYQVPVVPGVFVASTLRVEGYAPDPLQDDALRLVRAQLIGLQQPSAADVFDPAMQSVSGFGPTGDMPEQS